MKDEFIKELGKTIMLIRKRDLRQLGESPLLKDLSSVIENSLPSPLSDCSPVLIGDTLQNIINIAIESLKPHDAELDSPDMRIYIFLTEYVIAGKSLSFVADMLHVSRSTFYEIQNLALQQLANFLWHYELKAQRNTMILNNLNRPPYTKYIDRYDDTGNNFVDDVIIGELKEGRAWIVSLQGQPGVGKSSIAYAVAEKIVDDQDELLLPFQAVIWVSCRRDEFQPTEGAPKIIEKSSSMEAFFDEIATTLGNREIFQNSLDEKQEIVERLLKDKVCLIVLDNLDSAWIDIPFKVELEEYIQKLPRPHKVLVTMRQDDYWRGQTTIKIESMTVDEARQFLLDEAKDRRINPFTNSEFEIVFEKTFGTPIAMKQALGLTRINGYPLEQALDFQKYSEEMLRFMFGKAYKRQPEAGQKIVNILPLFADPASPDALGAVADVTGPEKTEALGRLYRGNLIEKVHVKEINEFRYTLLPFISEYLRNLRENPSELIGKAPINTFVEHSIDRMFNFYLDYFQSIKNEKERGLLILKTERNTLNNLLDWTWEQNDERFIAFVKHLGAHFGTLRYLNHREKLGRKAVEMCINFGREKDANWHIIHDVAWSLMRLGKPDARDEANKILDDAYNEAVESKWIANQALALMNIGNMALDYGNSLDSQKSLTNAHKLWKKCGDDYWENITLIALGRSLMKEKKYDKAAKIFLDLDDVFTRTQYLNGQIEVKSELALVHAYRGDFKEAIRLIKISEKYAESIAAPSYSLAYALSRHSEIAELSNELERAINILEKAKDIYNNLGVVHYVKRFNERIIGLKEKMSKKN